MFYVYIIKSISTNQVYIGFTNNLKRRLNEHNSDDGIYTSKYAPWKLVSLFGFNRIKLAMNFERYLKSGSGRAFTKKHFL